MSAAVAPAAAAAAARGAAGALAGPWLVGGLLALAAWLGAALLTAAVVAPAAFAALPTRALAGAVVGRVLPVLFLSGLAVGLVVSARLLLGDGDGGGYARARLVAAVVLAVSCAVAQFAIAPRIERLRASIGPSIEALSPDDPRRGTFGRLHGLSVLALGLGMLAATAATGLAAAAVLRGPRATPDSAAGGREWAP